MTLDEWDARLTAYALNDPGLSAADRAHAEAAVAADPAAAKHVEDTRALAKVLAAGYAAEMNAGPAPGITTPAKPPRKPVLWKRNLGRFAVACSILFAGGWMLIPQVTKVREASARRVYAKAPAGGADWADAPTAVAAKPAPDPLAAGFRYTAPAQPQGTAAPATPEPTVMLPAPAKPTGAAPVYQAPIHPADPKPADQPAPDGGKPDPTPDVQDYALIPAPAGNDRFNGWVENPFTPVRGQNALSTFGVDVDTASYAIVRRMLTMGQKPPTDAVRLEEIVNYFPYQDKPPTGDDPFAVTVEIADCPWKSGHRLARIGLKAKPIPEGKRPPSNLVFLIDVSGSMSGPDRLPLVKQALKLLVGQLGENDRVAMVVYAGAAGLVLDSTSAQNKDRILAALDRLEAGGSTNGAGGIQQAYDVAVTNFIKGGTNRVILCTDGDWNVGTTGTGDLVKLIEGKRATGVFLSVFGFGMGNLRDEMMVRLANKGNGNYGYIDGIREAQKAFVEQLGGTLVTVAKDVKLQIEFNPAAVKAYRLLGYEKRALAAKDFADDTKDAGEMGAGHVVTALYELVPAGDAPAPAGEGLRYQPDATPKPAPADGKASEAFVVKMRHKKPDGNVSTLRELVVPNKSVPVGEASNDLRFSAAAAAFALVLRESAYKGDATLGLALSLAEGAAGYDPGGHRAEFLGLVRRAQQVVGR